jgi:hypothetical protein
MMESIKEFPSFQLLPTELRLKIYHHAISSLPSRTLLFHSTTRRNYIYLPITLLSVNHEAREEVLKSYNKIESYLLRVPCYFNPDRDLVDLSELWRYEERGRSRLRVVRAFERNGVEARYIVNVDYEKCICSGGELRERYSSARFRRR